MSRRAGQITIDITAGTAKFVTEIDTAKAKLRELGGTGVSEHKAMAGAMKTVEGRFTTNTRAAEAFLAMIPGVGNAVKVMFPVIGAIAFIGIISEVVSKVSDFFKTIQEAPGKINRAFGEISQSVAIANDGLRVANANIENDIAKLEGKRQNGLAIALAEATEAADKLAESLEKDLDRIGKVLEANKIGKWRQVFGEFSDKGLREEMQHFQEEIIPEITSRGSKNIAKAGQEKDPAKQRAAILAAQTAMFEELRGTYKAFDEELGKQQATLNQKATADARGTLSGLWNNYSTILADYKKARQAVSEMGEGVGLSEINSRDVEKKRDLTAAAQNAKLGKPFSDRLKAMGAESMALQAKLEAVGKPLADQIKAEAFADAAKAIEEVNKQLEDLNTKLKPAEEDALSQVAAVNANIKADTEWRARLTAETTAIGDRIKSQQLLTSAIGAGYEATRAANVEMRTMQFYAAHPEAHTEDRAALAVGFGNEFDAAHAAQVGQATQRLQQSIELETALASAYWDGAEAVRQITLNYKLLEIARNNPGGGIGTEGVNLIEEEAAKRRAASAESLAAIGREIEARDHLNTAIMRGAAAERQAVLENEIAKIQAGVGTPDQKDQAIAAAKAKAQSEEIGRIAKIAESADGVRRIDDEINDLLKARNVDGANTQAIDADLLSKEKERLNVLRAQALASNDAADGARAVFLEMQANAKTTSQIVYDSIKEAVEGAENLAAKNLSDLATGQYRKGEFGKDAQRMAGSQMQSFLKMGMDKLVGGGKPDGTATNPLHVVMTGASGIGGASSGGPLGTVSRAASSIGSWFKGLLGKMFGGGSSDAGAGTGSIGLGDLGGGVPGVGGDLASILPGLAGGGDVDPGSAYWVGENGPEPFVPNTPGKVISRSDLGGSSGDTYHFTIDARNSELGAENRIARTIDAARDAAVAQSAAVNNERSKRVPQRGK